MIEHDLFAALRARTVAALAELLPDLPGDAFARGADGAAARPSHGDMATNAAMVVAKLARQAPPKLAAALAEKLAALPEVESATPAGPGFVNLRLREGVLRAQLPVILAEGERYGDGSVGARRRVDVEYVSANPTGPMHVGHCRGAVVGDALANLLAKAGWDVTKEYYINDAGAQVQALGYGGLLALPAGARHRADRGAVRRSHPRRAAVPRRIPGAGRRGAEGGASALAGGAGPEHGIAWRPTVGSTPSATSPSPR